MRRVDRRELLKLGAAIGAGAALGRIPAPTRAQSQQLSVLTSQRPDPIPPGVDNFADDLLSAWSTEHDTGVAYESHPFFEIETATRAAFDSGNYVHDVYYNWATIPELSANLVELGSRLPKALIDDLAPSQAASVSWQGKQYGVVPTLSLMLLFYNRTFFEAAGIPEPPATWDDLKGLADVFGGEMPNGLLMPYAAAAGIGGVASVWMAFLQQAGGRMYDETGKPVFDDTPGVDALQFMIDLLPITSNRSQTMVSYGEAAFQMSFGSAAITFSFPAFWNQLTNNAPPDQTAMAPAIMPKGPENNATINGVDAWTMAAISPQQDLAQQLIEFYLAPETQKRQFFDTGWLPGRLSVLADSEVQTASPIAPILLEQAGSPFESFVTPNYLPITDTIGREIQKALRREQSAAQALHAAKESIAPLIVW